MKSVSFRQFCGLRYNAGKSLVSNRLRDMSFKKYFLLSSLSLSLLSCGQSSKIKDPIAAEPFRSKVQVDTLKFDPENVIPLKFSFPIEPTPFESTLPQLGPVTPVVNELVKLLLKVGTVSGTLKFRLNQPIPELPSEYAHSVKLSRVFFVLQNENINFINKLAVMVTPKKIRNDSGIMTSSPTEEIKMSKQEKKAHFEMFDDNSITGKMANERRDKDVLVLKYDRTQVEKFLKPINKKFIYLIHSSNPAAIMDHIVFTMEYQKKGLLKTTQLMMDSVMVELIPDHAVRANFEKEMQVLSTYHEFGYKGHETCDSVKINCLDLKIPDIELMELVFRENSLQIEAFVDVNRAPKTFGLKGFIEIEAGVKDPIAVDGVKRTTGI